MQILLYVNVVCMWMRVDGRSVDLQYSRWHYYPQYNYTRRCVVVKPRYYNYWYQFDCNQRIGYVCQS